MSVQVVEVPGDEGSTDRIVITNHADGHTVLTIVELEFVGDMFQGGFLPHTAMLSMNHKEIQALVEKLNAVLEGKVEDPPLPVFDSEKSLPSLRTEIKKQAAKAVLLEIAKTKSKEKK